MGDMVGVHTKNEIKVLTSKDRAKLKARVVRELLGSKEIRAIIKKDPRVLTKDPRVRAILKRKLGPTFARLKNK
jgi:hypothetical protein